MIQQNTWLRDARLVDVAPTILYGLGVPIPEEMDGAVLQDLFVSHYRESNAVHYADRGTGGDIEAVALDLTPEEEEQIRRQLERLGYL